MRKKQIRTPYIAVGKKTEIKNVKIDKGVAAEVTSGSATKSWNKEKSRGGTLLDEITFWKDRIPKRVSRHTVTWMEQ